MLVDDTVVSTNVKTRKGTVCIYMSIEFSGYFDVRYFKFYPNRAGSKLSIWISSAIYYFQIFVQNFHIKLPVF